MAQLESLEAESETTLRLLSQPALNLDDETLEILLHRTKDVQRDLHRVDDIYIPCVLHSEIIDQFLLRVIDWSHRAHQVTQHIPFALASQSFSVYPHGSVKRNSPSIYLAPSSARLGLLFAPLLFHEFGHTLYEQHRQELADLIGDVQRHIARELTPRMAVHDKYHARRLEEHRSIVEGWLAWMQELFCDAVGVTIGGPAFAKAYSSLILTSGKREFTVPPERLAQRKHPVSWLRVRFFCSRLKALGFSGEAEAVLADWETTAHAFGVKEDYYGYYDESFFPVIYQALDDMLEEASPAPFDKEAIERGELSGVSPVPLLNEAWRRWEHDKAEYIVWEQRVASSFSTMETR